MIPFWLAWIIALTNVALGLFVPLVYPVFIAVIVSIIFLVMGVMRGFIMPPTLFDLVLVPIITLSGAFLLLFFGILTIGAVSLPQLILIGLIADLIAITTGFVPIVGDVFGAILNGIFVFLAIAFIAGFVPAALLGFLAFTISLIPGPIPLVTITFVVIKLLIG